MGPDIGRLAAKSGVLTGLPPPHVKFYPYKKGRRKKF